MNLTRRQERLIKALRQNPLVHYTTLRYYSDHADIEIHSKPNSDQCDIEELIINIFPLAQYRGVPYVSLRPDGLIGEIQSFDVRQDGVRLDLFMSKTVKKEVVEHV